MSDNYEFVHGIPMDVPQPIAGITFHRSWCAGPAYAQISGKITQKDPGPTSLDLDVVAYDKDNIQIGAELYQVMAKRTKTGIIIPSQKFRVDLNPSNCIPDFGYVELIVTPHGGDIQQGAKMRTTFRVKRGSP
jgi:hypothetical protein